MPDTDPEDIAVRGWGPVTIRVAWTLATQGVTVAPEVLRDARDHVWFHLDPDVAVATAEDAAEPLTGAFVARALGRPWTPAFPDDADLELPAHWRHRVWRGLSRNARAVLRLHLADGHPLSVVSERIGDDVLALEAAREGLREVLRQVAASDGVDLETWDDDRLDHLLHRLACRGVDGGPALLEVVDGLHPDHLQTCVRAARAYALVRHGQLKRADLVPPHGAARPTGEVDALVLHLHPDGRRHRDALLRELPGRHLPLGDDRILVDASDLAPVAEVLAMAAEVSAPGRDHLRGARVRGPGRWSRHGLLGPIGERVGDAARGVPWGTLEGLEELPEPLPPPPSARWAWAGVLAMTLLAAVVLDQVLRPEPPTVDHPLEVTTVRARQGVWLDFDVDESAYVFVVRRQDGALEVVLDSREVTDKIDHATGDGSYRLHALGDGLLVASASHPLPRFATMVATAQSDTEPLVALATGLREQDAGIDVVVEE